MLSAQAHTLDAIFGELARRASACMDTPKFMETYMKMALRAQTQARSTWEAISVIQNPPVARYVKQANISGGHQQVNNGSRALETENSPNELIEEHHVETMDFGAPSEASRTHTAVETVGEIYGTDQ